MNIDKNHNQKKKIFRILGITFLIIGGILIIRGIASFLFIINNFGNGPMFMTPKIGSIFIGMPFIFLGTIFTALGFMGDIARYQAHESAPIGRDVFNYMADGTKDGIKTVAKSINEGLKEEVVKEEKIICPRCLGKISKDAKFCEHCGEKVEATEKVCLNCQTQNSKDAKYCRNCGIRL